MYSRSNSTKARQIRLLHDVALDLQHCETVESVYHCTVEAAEDVLEFDLCIIALEEGGELPVRAQSSHLSSDGVTSTMTVDEGIAGVTYRTQQSYRFDDLSAVPEAKPQGPYTSGLSVPISDRGVFQAVAKDSAAFTDDDLQLIELLVSHTQHALNRVEQLSELEQFVNIVAHDLRNPLQVASGYLELAQDECESDHLDHIEEMHAQMDTFIEELLVLAQQGDILSECVLVDLPTILTDSWQSVVTTDATLDDDMDAGTRIEADSFRLQQLLANLFRNAIEHVGSAVTVRVGLLDDGFYVEDDGPGIPVEAQHRLFRRGYSTTEEGTGYGLHIVARIAHAHGWQLTTATGTDGGARFEFTNVHIESV